MDSLKIHNAIINRAINRKIIGYNERHHILPRCMGGLNTKDNIVRLTAKEHWLIHLLLIEIYPENPKLKIAIRRMMHKSGNQDRQVATSGRQFERLRIMAAKAHSEILKAKNNHPVFSKEHCQNISKAKKGKPSGKLGTKVSEAARVNMRLASKGRNSGDKNPMKRLEQRERMKINNPMHIEGVIENFYGEKNPNSKKVKLLSSGIIYATINNCMLDLKISKSTFYRMVKKNLIIYL